jgi:hypothetical protein
MTALSLPYDFIGGTRAIADQVDANFAAIVNTLGEQRLQLTAPTIFYVAPTGADVAGNGLAPRVRAPYQGREQSEDQWAWEIF